MTKTSSFLEVRAGEEGQVTIGGKTFDLGFVKKIYATHPTYIVWSDSDDLVWYEIDHTTVTLEAGFHSFWTRYQALRCQSLHNLSIGQQALFSSMLASALASALEKQLEPAEGSLHSAREFLDSANERSSKRRYLAGAVISGIVAIGASLLLYLIYYYFAVDRVIQLLAAAFGGGAVGAILSSTTGKIEDARFDPNASKSEGYLNGGLRVLYGLCGAFVAIVAVKSGVISSDFIHKENEPFAMFLVAVAGGFTERLAANILSTLSSKPESN